MSTDSMSVQADAFRSVAALLARRHLYPDAVACLHDQAGEWDEAAGREHGTASRRVSKTGLNEAADYLYHVQFESAADYLDALMKEM